MSPEQFVAMVRKQQSKLPATDPHVMAMALIQWAHGNTLLTAEEKLAEIGDILAGLKLVHAEDARQAADLIAEVRAEREAAAQDVVETPQTWTAVYWRYMAKYRETCDSLDAAVQFLADGEGHGSLSAVEILGPDGSVVIGNDEIFDAAYGNGRWAPDRRAETLRALGGVR